MVQYWLALLLSKAFKIIFQTPLGAYCANKKHSSCCVTASVMLSKCLPYVFSCETLLEVQC